MNITSYLYVPFAAWAIAQLIKFSLALIRGEVDFRYLYASGGMPSVHSAVVCSLATWALIEGGPGSPLFGFTAVFAGIVMYDSFGVRRSSGEQARTINRLIGDLSTSGGLKNAQDYGHLREILGHKPLEVVIGALLGIFIAGCFGFQKITTKFPVVFEVPNTMQAKGLMIFGVVVFVTMVPIYVFALKKYKKQTDAKTALTSLALTNGIAGAFMTGIGFIAYENVYGAFSQWYLIILVVVAWLAALVGFAVRFVQVKGRSQPSLNDHRKDKWLKKAGKKK